MPSCVAAWCANSSSKGFKMCNFPRDKERRNAWVKNMNRPNWYPTAYSTLCEMHFTPNMWEKVRIDGKKKLKGCAVPTIFITSRTPLLVSKEENETLVKRKNILDSITILRRKSRYTIKKNNELQTGRNIDLCKNKETDNKQIHSNSKFENICENNAKNSVLQEKKLLESEDIPKDSNG